MGASAWIGKFNSIHYRLNGTNCLKQRLVLHGSIIVTGLLRSEGRPCDDKATLESRDDPAMRWMNLNDQWAENDDFPNWMRQKFPSPSKWEKPAS